MGGICILCEDYTFKFIRGEGKARLLRTFYQAINSELSESLEYKVDWLGKTILFIILSMVIKNRVTEIVEPWGTPLICEQCLDKDWPTLT